MAVLVCGGAGYIGSHTVAELLSKGEEIVVVDSLYKGHRSSLNDKVKFCCGDLRDSDFMDKVFMENEIDAVIHFAADSLVGESVVEPLKYYNNNVYGAMCLLEKMKKYNVNRIVFSSTAAVYGEPESSPVLESDRTVPTNPYGETKLAVEKMLKWADGAYGIKHIVLRYFNVAGAHIGGEIGEDHRPESHLIPIILQVALGKREKIMIYGDDYETPDGTCVRDYIHVTDLANAHILAVNKLRKDMTSDVYNLGNGNGFSVKEVIEVSRRVTGHPIVAEIVPRRAGDPARLVASSEKAIKNLNWKPQYDKLEQIIETAWKWHNYKPDGYED